MKRIHFLLDIVRCSNIYGWWYMYSKTIFITINYMFDTIHAVFKYFTTTMVNVRILSWATVFFLNERWDPVLTWNCSEYSTLLHAKPAIVRTYPC